ncbi:MAG: T9SS type A sorting domain-containing protein [Bacteroidetes bacterium]|nr:T9SS type A sorting domain-containing protein [Bacteroidota bacterium]
MRKEIQLQNYVQCPSSGGPAVHKARIFVSLLNDSIIYNDGDICATMGIFKTADQTTNESINTELICFPNPASSTLQLLFKGLFGNEFNLEIHDATGKLVETRKFNSTIGGYYMNTSFLPNGLFHLIVRDNKGEKVSSKFVKAR